MTSPAESSELPTAGRFRAVAGRLTDVASAVAPSGWDAPSPCAGWTARDVIAHMVEWIPAFLGRAGVSLSAGPSLAEDPAGAWRSLSGQLQALLDDPAQASVAFDGGPAGQLTVASAIDSILLGDVFVHTWDIARAAGIDPGLDEDFAAAMLAGMEPMDDALRQSGHFGPKVSAAPDASAVDRLVAFCGRDPALLPPA